MFCSACGARIAVQSEDSDVPYIVTPFVKGARGAFGTHTATRRQFFNGLLVGLISIGIIVILLMLVGGPEAMCMSIFIVAMMAVATFFFWYWGRQEALKRP